MPALGYKKQFVPPILRKIKRQTIRNYRKKPICVGDHLYFFTGMRTKHCKKFGEAICTGTYPIKITNKYISVPDLVIKDITRLNAFAKCDGFKDWEDMKQWWKKNHGPDCFPFNGTLIEFKLLSKRQWLKK